MAAYVLIATNCLMLVVVIILLWLLLGHRRKQQEVLDPLLKLQAQIDETLEALKAHINKELAKYGRKNNKIIE